MTWLLRNYSDTCKIYDFNLKNSMNVGSSPASLFFWRQVWWLFNNSITRGIAHVEISDSSCGRNFVTIFSSNIKFLKSLLIFTQPVAVSFICAWKKLFVIYRTVHPVRFSLRSKNNCRGWSFIAKCLLYPLYTDKELVKLHDL